MAKTLTALFVNEAEAERAATQLRAAGVRDDHIRIEVSEPDVEREDEVGVPDSARGIDGLRGDEDAPVAHVRMTVDEAGAREDHAELLALIHAAGGRTE